MEDEALSIEEPVLSSESMTVAAGDPTATFARLLDRSLDRQYRLATAILGDPIEAEDAVHDAALVAWRGFGKLRDVDRFGGQANLAVIAADGTPSHYAGNGENPVFSFRLGAIGVVSTGIYSLDRSLFRFVAAGATERRFVPLRTTVSLDPHGKATAGA